MVTLRSSLELIELFNIKINLSLFMSWIVDSVVIPFVLNKFSCLQQNDVKHEIRLKGKCQKPFLWHYKV